MFIASLFTIANNWEQYQCSSASEQASEVYYYPYDRILLSWKKEWISDAHNTVVEPQYCDEWKTKKLYML